MESNVPNPTQLSILLCIRERSLNAGWLYFISHHYKHLYNQDFPWYYSTTPLQTSDRATWMVDRVIVESQTTFLLKKNTFKHPLAERD